MCPAWIFTEAGVSSGAISAVLLLQMEECLDREMTGVGKCLFGDFGHHLQICVGDYNPNSWVMFNLNIYQPLNDDLA